MNIKNKVDEVIIIEKDSVQVLKDKIQISIYKLLISLTKLIPYYHKYDRHYYRNIIQSRSFISYKIEW